MQNGFGPKVSIPKRAIRLLGLAAWALFFVTGGLTYYVNHYMPHGPSYPTGEIVCENDDRGPCGEEYKEDMRRVPIPEWAKFLREYFILVLMPLGVGATLLTARGSADE
jgi:hypothetical protein